MKRALLAQSSLIICAVILSFVLQNRAYFSEAQTRGSFSELNRSRASADASRSEAEIQSLISQLDSEDPGKVVEALKGLALIKERQAVLKIIELLKHPHDGIKVTAAAALGEIGDERAIGPLLENPDLIVIEFGHSPVAMIGAPALPALVDLAKKGAGGWSSRAIHAISNIRDERAIPGLKKLLNEENSDLRLAAAQALAAMGVEEGKRSRKNEARQGNQKIDIPAMLGM